MEHKAHEGHQGDWARKLALHIRDRQFAQCLQELDALGDESRQVVLGVIQMAIRSSKVRHSSTPYDNPAVKPHA